MLSSKSKVKDDSDRQTNEKRERLSGRKERESSDRSTRERKRERCYLEDQSERRIDKPTR